LRRPGANRATCVVEVGVSLPRRISGQVILVMSGRGRMMYPCLQPEPEGAILPKRSAPQEVNSSPHDAGASMANWLETNIQGGGVAPTPSPQNRTGSRVGGWRGRGSCRGSYVLAENRLRPFPSAPLRTARESFDLKQLASGLCFERAPLR